MVMTCQKRSRIACSGTRREQKSRSRNSQRKICNAGESLQAISSTRINIQLNTALFLCTFGGVSVHMRTTVRSSNDNLLLCHEDSTQEWFGSIELGFYRRGWHSEDS